LHSVDMLIENFAGYGKGLVKRTRALFGCCNGALTIIGDNGCGGFPVPVKL